MIGKILGNRYEIIERIGGGGMSYVYKAKCNVLNRFVAIKVLRQELTSDPDFVANFKQESLSAASLTHPNIVNIYDTGIEDDIYYIVMEYVKGETLKKYIQRKDRLSEQETIKITKQIAEALKHAHLNKIVHRDIKPHNILLTEEGIAKVADFGIARAASSSTINNTSNVIGSVHYFSPEQARGGYVDDKSDIYSLGVVMYEMITGVVPFDGDNHITVAMKQIQENAELPTTRIKNLKISKSLEDIIMKCLEKHQSFRYQSVDELIKKLDNLSELIPTKNHEEEIIDSPTIVMPKINSNAENPEENKKVIDIDLFDKNSDNAFKTFFGEKESNEEDNLFDEYQEQDEDGKKSKNLKITLAAILSALAVAIIGGLIGFRAMLYVPEVTMPDLIGRDEEEAEKIIEDLGLVFNISEREYNDDFEEGKVVDQSEEEGTKLKENYTVDVIISKGQREIKVPNLIGKYAIEAGLILSEAGLEEGRVTEDYSENVPSGQIIDQSPVAETSANENDSVDYVISKGPEIIYTTMPNVEGLELETAKQMIIQYGLTVGQITEENDENIAEGLVIKQSVPAGQDVEQGSSIWMTVSLGPKETENEGNDSEDNEDNEKPDEPAIGTYPLTIKLPSDKEKVLVVVQRVTDSGIEILYSEEVNTSEKSIIINIEGKGTQIFDIYIDNELYDRAEITFE
ncbi:Stk1 family PASTA domain-containing Ser/Thr kinase [Sedimentibacter sp. MB31-C6]|uniref:Stk1 family PASTA domain-containing Ser/Thr kinase n=1 Tax=Sedimentibacter sp. MB31-C6 TaxID=3109366 RepID=UPI002DDD5349|nr:Stk1 family PASTA domain-containing Ser/Thr kinase [Sedimentibacter sp. MB36-C1]WSI04324.1 Stk1 family PASTA domain-containing Ser/Thr kinase [Sedimentibacter sp. MB36-C1]